MTHTHTHTLVVDLETAPVNVLDEPLRASDPVPVLALTLAQDAAGGSSRPEEFSPHLQLIQDAAATLVVLLPVLKVVMVLLVLILCRFCAQRDLTGSTGKADGQRCLQHRLHLHL